MFREKTNSAHGRHCSGAAILVTLVLAVVLSGTVYADSTGEQLDYALESAVLAPVQKWATDLKNEKNAAGRKFRRVTYSRTPHKVDENTYELSAHVNTAKATEQLTERYNLVLTKESGKGWEISDKQIVDTRVGLFRTSGMGCFPFDSFSFDREGMTLSASNGRMCAEFLEGGISRFGVHADDLRHDYEPPPHVQRVETAHDFFAMHEYVSEEHAGQLEYTPAAFIIDCDARTCEELVEQNFTGLTLPSGEGRDGFTYDVDSVDSWVRQVVKDIVKDRKDDAFDGFGILDREDETWYQVFLPTELRDADDGIWLRYDKWGGWEVQFGIAPKRYDIPDQLAGAIYGYYSEETIENSDPYSLERRENRQSRWFEVYGLKGEVDLATETSEVLHGNVEFDLTLKQEGRDLPFFIIANRDRALGSGDKAKPIIVSSIEVDGEPVTWVQTGSMSGRVLLPEVMPAGSRVKVRMDWKSNTILNYTHSYSYLPRQGWMPFVSFGDVIDEFELTLRTPSKYQIIGVGRKTEETIENEIRTSHWKSDSPVNFPTIIFGRYKTATPSFDATKADGTPIPITMHVDEASFTDWDIKPKSLRPLAEQAANAINLYREVSGLDYPFGELNLVNDPRGFLYGQAPSSLIYLGSGVFRGEGWLATRVQNPAGIAKFLKSVVAHEVGHQWWGNRIANANNRNYWFVETLAEYFSAVYLEAAFGPREYQGQVDDWRRSILDSTLKSSVQNASTLFSGEGARGGYQAAVYNKGPYAFHMLRETFKGEGPPGPEGADKKFFAFLKDFSIELGEKREIVSLDIQYAAEKALGGVDANGQPYTVDLSWFFDQWIRGSGVPQYSFEYDVRETEDGNWLIEGLIKQRVFLGESNNVMKDTFYRGVVDVTVIGKGGPYEKRVVINEPQTTVKLKVPVKPLEVTLNSNGEMLARDTMYGHSW